MQALGRYELLNQIGAGGMGTVYRARDPRLDREVAIKIVRLEHFSDSAQREHLIRRFETEARAAARLKHPNIVAVHDFGEEHGQAFLVMELAVGKNLSETLRGTAGRALPVNQVLRVLRECAGALDHAHGMGVIHRDVKPANLIVLGDGSVKLSDFGIARIATLSGLTMTGQTLGTPHYMAPEALDPREDRPVDGRSDQFSLAVMAYEMVMGRRPFEGDSLAALSLKILQAAPPTVELEPHEAAEELNRIFQRGLAKNAADRYPSCRTMVVEIEAACRGVQAFPAPPVVEPIPLVEAAPEEGKATRISVPRGDLGDSLSGESDDRFGLERSMIAEGSARPEIISDASAAPPPKGPKGIEPEPKTQGPWKWIGVAIAAAALMGLAIWMNDRPSLAPVAKSEPAPAAPPAGMVLVSEGEAALGPEGIRTQVAPYYIDKTEVTNAEWLKFCKATGRDCTGWAQADAALPVVNVSFDEATEYAAWAGKRLPSWIEWEKAARGADGRSFPWGNEFRYDAANLPKDREAAQTGRLGRADALPAGASLSGTLNQVGNAWEWVASTTVPSEARFADLGRIFASLSPPLARTEKFYQVRGGSFKSAFPKEALPQLLTDWTPMPGRGRRDDIGFRCVKDY